MAAAQQINRLIQDIVQDRKNYISLGALLEQQRQTFMKHDAPALDALNEQLLTEYQRLQYSANVRQQTLQQLGLTADNQGLQTLFTRLPAPHREKAAALWGDLQQRATRCKQLNERNGMLLNMQQELMSDLLNAGESGAFLYHR